LAQEDRTEFVGFLGDLIGSYFVLTDDAGGVIACGGYGEKNGVGILTWGMVRRDLHKQGLGRLLLRQRVQQLKQHQPHISEIQMNTSHHSVNFFEREGFRATRITMNGFAPGLHEYHLRLEIRERRAERLA